MAIRGSFGAAPRIGGEFAARNSASAVAARGLGLGAKWRTFARAARSLSACGRERNRAIVILIAASEGRTKFLIVEKQKHMS
jgi:hypothetical protein